MVRLPWHITDAAFVRRYNRLVVVDVGNTMQVIDPEYGRIRKVTIDHPERVALSPDGGWAAVASQTSWISLVNLETLQVEHRVLPAAPRTWTMLRGSLALSDDLAYLAPAIWDVNDKYPEDINLRSIDFHTGQTRLASKALAEPGMRIKFAPIRKVSLHGVAKVVPQVRPPPTRRAALGAESVVTQVDPSGNHACGDFWFSQAGDYVFTKCGDVYSLSEGANTGVPKNPSASSPVCSA